MKKYCPECEEKVEHINERCMRCGWTEDIEFWQKKEDNK